MAIEGFTALPEASRKAQTTTDRARYWLKLLGIQTVKSGNIRYVPDSAISPLWNMARLVAEGCPPGEAAKKAKEEKSAEAVPVIVQTPVQDTRLEGIEKALLTMAGKMQIMIEENRALKTQLSAMQERLEYKPMEKKPTPGEEEKPLPVVVPNPPAPIRAEVPPPARKEPVQRRLSFMEGIAVVIGNFAGFVWGD